MINLPLHLNSFKIFKQDKAWMIERDWVGTDGQNHVEILNTNHILVTGNILTNDIAFPINLLFKNEEED